MAQAPQREARQAAVAAEFRRHMARGALLSIKAVASAEAPAPTLEQIAASNKPLDLARLGAVYEAALALDRAAAVALVEGVLRAAGIQGSFVPEAAAESSSALLVESAEAGAAVGEVQAAVLRAAPIEEVRRAAIRASRELADVVVLTQRIEGRAQPALRLEAR